MAKKIKAVVKVQAPAGKATPAPPIGPALGATGIAIGEFVKQFNDRTAQMGDMVIPAVITVYEDRSFTFELKTPPASEMLKKAAKISKGSGVPNKDKVAKISRAQIREIAEKKMDDLNALDLDAASKIIEGTAKNMGLEVTD
jgi:large subunit ribosomal protein L11